MRRSLSGRIALLAVVLGTLVLALDGLHYWHDIRFLFATTHFSLSELLDGVFNPHQSWGAIDETASAGFYLTKVLHFWFLGGLFALVSPSQGGLTAAVAVSIAMMGVTALGAGLLIRSLISRADISWLGAACFLLVPVVPYLAGKQLSEVSSLMFTTWGLLFAWGAIKENRRAGLLTLLSGVLLLLAALARLDSLIGPFCFFVAVWFAAERGDRRRLASVAAAVTGFVAAAYVAAMAYLGAAPSEFIRYLQDFVNAPNRPLAMSLLSILCFGGVAYLLAAAALLSSRRRVVGLFIIWWLVAWLPLIVLTSNFMVEPRYLVQGSIPFAGLATLGLEELRRRIRPRRVRILAAVGLAMALAVNALTIRLMPYELDSSALLEAAQEIVDSSENAAILVPWAYSDFAFLRTVRPSLNAYSVHSPRGLQVDEQLAAAWNDRYRRWYEGRHLSQPEEVRQLLDAGPVYYLGWHRYPPAEFVEGIAVRFGLFRFASRLRRRLNLTDHIDASWVRDWPGVRLESAGSVGQYEYYRVVSADSPPDGRFTSTDVTGPAREIVLPIDPTIDGRGGLIVSDLTGDGIREIIVTRPNLIVVATLDNRILWQREVDIQVTSQSERNGLPGWHGPGIQAGDIDGDGVQEVVYLTRSGFLEVLDGRTGELRRRVALEAPEDAARWEHAVLVNFSGTGNREVLLQATNRSGYRMGRFLAAFSMDEILRANRPVPLWERDDFVALAHSGLRVADLDGDGRDEVIGAGIVRWDGQQLYDLPVRGHIDAVVMGDVRPDLPGLEVVALEEGGNRVFLFGVDGLIWERDYRNSEPQNVAIGDFLPDRPGLELWCRSRYEFYQRPFVFDAMGEFVTAYELTDVAPSDWTVKGVEVIFPIHWTGGNRQLLAAKERHIPGDVAILDAMSGEFVARIPENADRLFVADVLDDWREELVVLSGAHIRIYENSASNPQPDHPSLWSQQYYERMKQTWNYYVP